MRPHSSTLYQVIREKKVIGIFSVEELAAGVQHGSLLATDHYTLGSWPMPRSLAELFPVQTRARQGEAKLMLRHATLGFLMLVGLVVAGAAIYTLMHTTAQVPVMAVPRTVPVSQSAR